MFQKEIHYSPNMENGIIGACLLEPSAFSRIFDLVESETFYETENSVIFSAMAEMFKENVPTDLLTVFDYLARRKGISEFNGKNAGYVLTLKTNGVTSTANLEYYAMCIKQMWLDREITNLTLSGSDNDKDAFEKISDLRDKIQALSQKTTSSDWQDMAQLMVGLYKHQDNMVETKGMGKITGFSKIDRNYGGFHNGQMIVIAARPSVGKSAFSGQIGLNMALSGVTVGIVSLEMNNNEIAARLASLDTGIEFSQIFRGLYADENDRERFYKKINSTTSEIPIYVTDSTDVNVTDIKAKAYKLKQKHGLGCLIIDYLQLVGSESSYNKNRENEVAKISRGVKIIAKELNIPVIILAQLNREVEKRKGADRFPMLSDLRESGAIEQDADVVMFLHSDFKSGHTVDENGASTEGKAHLVIRKWRNGDANQIIDLDFNGPMMKFSERNSYAGFKPITGNDF